MIGFSVNSWGSVSGVWLLVTGLQAIVFLLRSLCFLVGEVKPQLFTVDVGLRQGGVLLPLLFVVYTNCI